MMKHINDIHKEEGLINNLVAQYDQPQSEVKNINIVEKGKEINHTLIVSEDNISHNYDKDTQKGATISNIYIL